MTLDELAKKTTEEEKEYSENDLVYKVRRLGAAVMVKYMTLGQINDRIRKEAEKLKINCLVTLSIKVLSDDEGKVCLYIENKGITELINIKAIREKDEYGFFLLKELKMEAVDNKFKTIDDMVEQIIDVLKESKKSHKKAANDFAKKVKAKGLKIGDILDLCYNYHEELSYAAREILKKYKEEGLK